MGNFDMLPGDIIFNILTRVPAETVLECKLVSKSWNTIVRFKSFAQTHLNHCLENLGSTDGSGKFTFLTVNDNPIYAYREFHYLEYNVQNSSSEEPFHKVTRVKINPDPFIFYNFTGSCNGLVCLNGTHDNDWVNYEPIYVCNPITRECVFLPAFKRTPGRCERMVTGFGYVSAKNEYKVVRMYYLLKERNSVRVEVYTLGSGKGWRKLGKKLDKDLESFNSIHGVLFNESLYYVLTDGKVVAFDLANEIFIELPRLSPTSWRFELGVLRGYLSACHYDNESNTSDILLLKETKKKMQKKKKKKKEDGPLSWVKEFSLRKTDACESLVLTCGGTVLCRSLEKVYIHDLKSTSSKVLVDFSKGKRMYQAIPHVNTLVSLKAIGEKNTKTMETYDVPREVIDPHTVYYEKNMKKVQGLYTAVGRNVPRTFRLTGML